MDQTFPLSDGLEIPIVGFGTYLIKSPDTPSAVGAALQAGYRHIDTAEVYRNEKGVGAAIRDSGLPREALFVTTKLWPGARKKVPRDAAATIAAMEGSLTRLGLSQVELYLIHAPLDRHNRLAQWRGLVELQQRGKARAIGVSNYSVEHIQEIAAAGLPLPAANQIELHPWSQKPALVGYLRDNGILPIAYSSLVPMSTWRAAAGQRSAKTAEMRAEGERPDAPFRKMAAKYDVSEAQVLLRWAVQRGFPVLPKSTKPDRIRQNADLFSFAIDDEDMAAIAQMDRGQGVAWSAGDPTALR